MAKLVSGVKSVNSSALVTVRVPVQKFQTTNGKRFDTPQAANDEQKTTNGKRFDTPQAANDEQKVINIKTARVKARKPLEAFLKQQGIAYRSASGIVSLARLTDAMLDPNFTRTLAALAR